MHSAILADHRRQVQLSAAALGQREADQPATMLGHEIHGIGRDEVGRNDKIAFVLAILFVDKNHHTARLEVGDDLRNGADRLQHGFQRGLGVIDCVQPRLTHDEEQIAGLDALIIRGALLSTVNVRDDLAHVGNRAPIAVESPLIGLPRSLRTLK